MLQSSGIELISSLKYDSDMARPRNFSREGVLEKALPVFWKHGFADASLQEREKATGVNKSGLYSEFSGKEDSGGLTTIPEHRLTEPPIKAPTAHHPGGCAREKS